MHDPQQIDSTRRIQDGCELLKQVMEARGWILVANLGKHCIELRHYLPRMVLKSCKENIRFTLKVKIDQALVHASPFCNFFISCCLKPTIGKNGQSSFQNLLASVNTRYGRFTRHGLIIPGYFIIYLTK